MRKHCPQVVIENFFEPCVLYLLLQKPSYGYEIFTALEKDCTCSVNMGNLYRNLNRLNREGFVTKKESLSALGPKKSIYALTKKGQALFSEWMTNLSTQNKIIEKLITNYQKVNAKSQTE